MTSNGERLGLVAREVMAPSWRRNDNQSEWNEPSLDFLAVDADGRPVAIEVKRRLTGPKAIRYAVCQVTAMTLLLAESATEPLVDRIRAEYLSARSGGPAPTPVRLDRGWRRVLAAEVIDDQEVVRASEALGVTDPTVQARRWQEDKPSPHRQVARLARLAAPPPGTLVGGIEALTFGTVLDG